MRYFRNFPRVDYKFGDEFINVGGGDAVFEITQDISSYVDVIDDIKQSASFYSKYTILENDRPDIVSEKIYGTPAYHWTFYIMNDNIRTYGWPLTMIELEKKVKRDFPHKYIETRADLTGTHLVGERTQGAQSGAIGTIEKRFLDLGVIIVDADDSFQKGEVITNAGTPDTTQSIAVAATGFEYNAPRYYTDGDGLRVDIDPAVGPGALLTEVTNFDHYVKENEKLREITVIRPDAITSVVGAYFQAMGS
jgi:hypothetical protein